MGSGSSSGYQGISGGERSQPYSPFGYHVDEPMLQKDKEDGTWSETNGYRQNPTAVNLESAIRDGKVYIDGKVANGTYTYVIDAKGNVIVGKRNGGINFRTPHPSLIGGKDPVVLMAGMLTIKNGKIDTWDDRSGHFKPNIKSMKFADIAFRKYIESFSNKRRR